MCLAEPYRVIKVLDKSVMIDCHGKQRKAECILVEGLREGDYILLHGDKVIQKLDPDDARETLDMIRELGCGCTR